MRGVRKGWLLVGAILLAASSLLIPITLKGIAQRRIAALAERAGVQVVYDCDPADFQRSRKKAFPAGVKGRLIAWFGREFVGNIRRIEIWETGDGSALAELLDQLQNVDSLVEFHVIGPEPHPVDLEQIGRLRSLESLMLFYDAEPDFTPLGNLPALRSLGLKGNAKISAGMLDALAAIPALEQLDLSFCWVDRNDVAKFCSFRTLRTLNLIATKISANDLLPLKDAPNVQAVVVGRQPDFQTVRWSDSRQQLPPQPD